MFVFLWLQAGVPNSRYPPLLAELNLFTREELEVPPMRPMERVLIVDILRDTLVNFAASFTECVKQVWLCFVVCVCWNMLSWSALMLFAVYDAGVINVGVSL